MKNYLSKITPFTNVSVSDRPTSSLVELIDWTRQKFVEGACYHSYLHNKFSVDNKYLDFCEEKGYKVTCLFRDPTASWDEDGQENFNAQGVFKTNCGSFTFYHAALFHKGNQNEDEVSFFSFVENSKYEDYTALRDEYTEWLKALDRDTDEIYVVGDDPIPFSRELTWDDVILEQSLKDEIKLVVEGFLNTEKFCERHKIPWKKGVIFHGDPGNGKTMTMNVLISQYNFKPVTIRGSVGNDTDELIEEAFSYAEEHGPSLLFLEDLPGLLQNLSLSHFLQLLDGIKSRSGIFIIATANDLSDVDSAISNRPSRFDRKIEFPLPSTELSLQYLNRWFKHLPNDYLAEVVKKTVKAKFSFAYLKELYSLSVYHAIARMEEDPKVEDIDKALAVLIKDKKAADGNYQVNSGKRVSLTGK